MSQPRQDVIDLTQDTSSPPETPVTRRPPQYAEGSTAANRPPRFNRNIINVDEQDDGVAGQREESPEIEILSSRPRSRSLSATRTRSRRRSAIAPGIHSPRRRPPHQASIRTVNGDRNPHQIGGWADALHNLSFPTPYHANLDRTQHGDRLVRIERTTVGGGRTFQLPENLNFLQAGFDYEQPSRPQQQPRLPTYDPPPPAQQGFTRSPNEDDILVCPHCDDELGVGKDEVKRQVWVVKACGHVRARYHRSPITLI